MKAIIAFLFAALLTGCVESIYQYELERAEYFCRNKGGVARISTISMTAFCVNGGDEAIAKIKIDDE